MSKYIRNDNVKFDSYEAAWKDAMTQMSFSDFVEYFEDQVGYWNLLTWAKNQPGFYKEFGDAISDLAHEYFHDYYWEVDKDEDR